MMTSSADIEDKRRWMRSLDNLADGGDYVIEYVTPDGLIYKVRMNDDFRVNINLMDEAGDTLQDSLRVGKRIDDGGEVTGNIMSITYNFKITIVKRENANLLSMNIIDSFLENGWSLYSEKNEIIYTDIGDNDDFDFKAKSMSKNEYFDIVNQKEKHHEIIAVAMFYLEEYHRYRIDVILTPEFDILISPDDITKKMLSSSLNILDMNWYLCKIMPALINKNMLVEGVSYTQF